MVEFYEDSGLYDPAMDKATQEEYDDTRRPRLTLRKLNKMRKSKDMARLDREQHLKFIPIMYSTPTEE